MKHILALLVIFIWITNASAQSDGMSYQAVILDKNPLEIPGMDVGGNFLAETEITLRFTIEDPGQNIEYQESQLTTTDPFGMVNVIIGQGLNSNESPGNFNEINWNGEAKFLIIDLAYGGSELEELSRQNLLFVPYAYHRNIIATQTLDVDGATTLNNTLNVFEESTLEDLIVNGSTQLNQTLTVEGASILNNSLSVNGSTDINGEFNVVGQNPATFSGTVTSEGETILNGTFTANSTSCFNDQVTIKTQESGGQSSYDAYPLRVEGSTHGIAIKVTDGLPDSGNNFISFFDSNGNVRGRIEGETLEEVYTSPEYIYNLTKYGLAGANAGANLATALLGVQVCAGVGVVTCPPSWSDIVIATANVAFVIADAALYDNYIAENTGVTYASGSADYAEYLEQLITDEIITAGDVVGVIGGKITLDLTGASQILVVSTKPAMLGNMPEDADTKPYEKVAFMGQVPVKVFGEVEIGDYIIPSGNNDGIAVGVSAKEITLEQYSKIVGIAWSGVKKTEGISRINISIGLNYNDLAKVVARQQKEISQIKSSFELLNSRITALEKGESTPTDFNNSDAQIISEIISKEKDIRSGVYDTYERPETIDRELVEEALKMTEDLMIEQGIDVINDPLLSKLFYDEEFKEKVIQETIQTYNYALKANF